MPIGVALIIPHIISGKQIEHTHTVVKINNDHRKPMATASAVVATIA
jgi:hypothetical protein